MKPLHAATSGTLIGFLFGAAICLFQNIPVTDSLFRIFILTLAGCWMGLLLAWLNQLLPSKSNSSEHRDSGV